MAKSTAVRICDAKLVKITQLFNDVTSVFTSNGDMGVSENRGPPKSSILIGFFLIFTIHFGGPAVFLETPIYNIGVTNLANQPGNIQVPSGCSAAAQADRHRVFFVPTAFLVQGWAAVGVGT